MNGEHDLTLDVVRGLRDGIRETHPEGADALDDAIEALEASNELIPWIDALDDVITAIGDFVTSFGETILVEAFRAKWPRIFDILVGLGLVEIEYESFDIDAVVHGVYTVHWDQLGRLFDDPQAFDSDAWGGGQVAVFMGLVGMMPRAIEALESGALTTQPRPDLPADPPSDWELFRQRTSAWTTLSFPVLTSGPDRSPLDHIWHHDRGEPEADLTIAWREDPLGWVETWLLPRPVGDEWVHDIGDRWLLRIAPAIGAGFAHTDQGWQAAFEPAGELTPPGLDTPVEVTIDRNAPPSLAGGRTVDYRFGTPDINLTLGDIGAAMRIRRAEPHLMLQLAAREVSLVVAPRALGAPTIMTQGLRFDLDFALDFSSLTGVGLALTSTAEIVFDIHRDDNAALAVTRVRLVGELGATETSFGARLRAHLTLVADFGSLLLVVDGFGAWFGYWPPPALFQHTYYGLLAPHGLGLEIQTDGFTGGGFLDFEGFESNRYSGTAYVKAGGVRVHLLGTYEELDDGTSSLVAIGGTRFPGIPLFAGILFDGLGALVAVHRRIDADELRARVVTGALGNLLYAPDPVAGAPQLLSELEAIFPTARNVQAFGGIANFSWQGVILAQLGFVLEFTTGANEYGSSGLTKVLFVGSARLEYEQEGKEKGSKADLQHDTVGIIDIPRAEITFDSSMSDSHLMDKAISISGDAAARLRLRPPEYFLISIGGVHPAFDPAPYQLPNLARAGASVQGKWGPITLSASLGTYFAVSSTAVQLGAEARFEVSLESILTASIWFGFDALLQFNPFHFSIAAFGGASISVIGFEIVEGFFLLELSGPGPLLASYTIGYSVFFGLISDTQTGTAIIGDPTPQIPSFSGLSLLEAVGSELTRSENVGATGGDDGECDVEAMAAGELPLVSPLGQVRWSQERAPLDCLCDRLAGERLPRPQAVVVAVDSLETSGAVRRLFAPSSYSDLDTSRALNGASFDQLEAGVELGFGWIESATREKQIGVTTHVLDIDIVITDTSPAQAPAAVAMASIARAAPTAIQPTTPTVVAEPEGWQVVAESQVWSSPSAFDAAQRAHHQGGVAIPAGDMITYAGPGP